MPSLRNTRQIAASETPSAADSVPPPHPANPGGDGNSNCRRMRRRNASRILVSCPAAADRTARRSPCRKPLAPPTHRIRPHPKFARDLVLPLAIKASQNDLSTLDQAGFRGAASGDPSSAHQPPAQEPEPL